MMGTRAWNASQDAGRDSQRQLEVVQDSERVSAVTVARLIQGLEGARRLAVCGPVGTEGVADPPGWMANRSILQEGSLVRYTSSVLPHASEARDTT